MNRMTNLLAATVLGLFFLSGCGGPEQDKTSGQLVSDDLIKHVPVDRSAETAPLMIMGAQISNQKYGGLLRPLNAKRSEGTPLVLHPSQPWKCMSWKFDRRGNQIYQLTNYFTEKSFQPLEGQIAPPIPLVQASLAQNKAQLWQFVPIGSGLYKILSVETGLALTAVELEDTSQIAVFLSPWENSEQQQWVLDDLPKKLKM